MDNLKGQSLKGYELSQLVGSGGFGAVYQAHQTILDREVAIKVILPHHANDPHFIRNFEAEAHLIARLEHPYIVPLYDFWRNHEGAYLVMRYYPTGNLSQLVHRGGAIDIETVARMIEQVASALDAAHSNNIIHRDIKPANILLDAHGNAYLSDFGLAEDITIDDDIADMAGSPAYIPPEVIRNEKPSPLSDLYSLGFVLYEMLTGKYAFEDITPDSYMMSIFDYHLNHPIPEALELSDAINLVLQRATSKDPLDRYPSALAMASAFRQAMLDDGLSTISEPIVASEYIVNPFKGLRAFDEADEYTFFGRDKLVKKLIQRLEEDSENHNFLALVGPSGSGKSSVVSAGLIPAIRRGELYDTENWYILDMVPGTQPFAQLVAELRSISLDPLYGAEDEIRTQADGLLTILPKITPRPTDRVLLIIDQFEELFTQTTDNTVRRQFLDALYTALQSENFYLIITLRADFYDRPMLHQGFGNLIQARTQVVLPLTTMELNNVITLPATYAGLSIEPALTTAIVADVQAEAVTLPLLQYALTEVFERRDEHRLTLEGYEAIGGIAGALAYRADELFNQLTADQQQITRQIFLRFVTLGEGTEDTRRRVKRSELQSVVADKTQLQAVLDTFGQARLLTFDNDEETREPTVEVAHEALIREWHRLRDWLDNSRHDIRRQRMLNGLVQQWLISNKDESYLLRGTQLSEFEAWQSQSSIELSQQEENFIFASHADRDRLKYAEKERQAHEMRLEQQSKDRLRLLLVVFGIAAIVAAGLSFFGLTQARNASAALVIAEDNQAAADASRLNAQRAAEEAQRFALAASALTAYDDGSDQLALALALEAVTIDDQSLLDAPPEFAYETLINISHAPGLMYNDHILDFPISNLVVAPNGIDTMIASGRNPSSYMNITRGGAPNNQGGTGNPPPPNGAQPPPQGNPPPAMTTIYRWHLLDRVSEPTTMRHDSLITSMLFTTQADGTILLISASDDGKIIIWDYETEEKMSELQTASGYVVISVADDAQTLFVSTSAYQQAPATLELFDMTTGEKLTSYPARDDLALARMTTDARHIVGLHLNGDLVTWDVATGSEVMSTNNDQTIRPSTIDLVIHPDNQQFTLTIGGENIPYYELETGRLLGQIQPSAPSTHRVSFSADGKLLIAASRDGVITVWNYAWQTFQHDFRSIDNMPTNIFYNTVNDTAIVTSNDGNLQVYSLLGDYIDFLNEFGDDDARDALWLDDTQVIVAYRNGELSSVNTETGEIIQIDDLPNRESVLSLSLDKKYLLVTHNPLVVSSIGTEFRIYDLETFNRIPCDLCQGTSGEQIEVTFLNHMDNHIAFADGDRLSLWNLEDQSLMWQLDDLPAIVTAIASNSDAAIIALGLSNGRVILVDSVQGDIITSYTVHDGDTAISVMQFAHDDSILAIVEDGSDETLLVDPVDGAELLELTGHDGTILGLQFFADSTTLITSSNDASVLVWDTETGEIMDEYLHEIVVFNVALSPDETRFLSMPEDLSPQLWSLEQFTLEEAIAWATENRLVRALTEAECSRYTFVTYEDCED
ncbi:MAG: protein kinase [Phototrophicaceae bacterium]